MIYDALAPVYDDLLRKRSQIADYAAWLCRTLDTLGASRIIDAAAGTGAQAIAIASRSLTNALVCNDLSEAMLDQLQAKFDRLGMPYCQCVFHGDAAVAERTAGARETDCRVTISRCAWQHLQRDDPDSRWDAIVCVGDSIAHATTRNELQAVFRKWHELLVPGGHVLVDYATLFDLAGSHIREGTVDSVARKWIAGEQIGESGTHYLVVMGERLVMRASAPSGWLVALMGVIGVLTSADQLEAIRPFSYETSLLDASDLCELAAEIGFESVSLPCGPSPKLHQAVRDLLFRKIVG